MKRIYAFAPATRLLRFLGLAMLVPCITASAVPLAPSPYSPQQRQDQRARAFVLEGIGAVNTDIYGSKLPVEVYRDGRKLELRPGDELREGDRVKSLAYTGETTYSGAFVAIYNGDGEPVLIVGHNRGVDFTISKLRFDRARTRMPRVEIVNHSTIPPAIDMEIAGLDPNGGVVEVYKPDGTRERALTAKEQESFEVQMDLDKPHRRDARWIRARRIIQEGRKGAEQEYSVVERELEAADRANSGDEERLRAEQAARRAGEGEAPTLNVSGTWDFVCCSKKYTAKLTLVQTGNTISGYFGQTSNGTTGEIEGQLNGTSLTFRRRWSGGTQDYTLTVSADGKTLTGSFSGDRDTSVGTEVKATRP